MKNKTKQYYFFTKTLWFSKRVSKRIHWLQSDILIYMLPMSQVGVAPVGFV